MGIICTPAYVNIFMDHFEINYIYPLLKWLSLSYLKFIDIVFFIWTGSEDQLTTFLNNSNEIYNSIKFEYNISQSIIPFIDTDVYIKISKLCPKIYRKGTGRQMLLHINLENPISLKKHTP